MTAMPVLLCSWVDCGGAIGAPSRNAGLATTSGDRSPDPDPTSVPFEKRSVFCLQKVKGGMFQLYDAGLRSR